MIKKISQLINFIDLQDSLHSPSDLIAFLECRHASFLDMQSLTKCIKKTDSSATANLLQKKGLEHEENYLKKLKESDKNIVKIPKDLKLQDRFNLTLKAIKSGADAIYQAVLLTSKFRGDADFLIKCNKSSDLGDFSYEVLDVKLSSIVRPAHLIQLCAYSELIAYIQGSLPTNMYLFLGDREQRTFCVSDFFHYYARAKIRFEAYLQNLRSNSSDSYPEPCSNCDYCRWKENCNEVWERDGHLSLIANIRRTNIDKLRKSGIDSISQLASLPSDKAAAGLSYSVFSRLHSQAILQYSKQRTGKDRYKFIEFLPNKGFGRMPMPNTGDLFFDMEGDPLYPNGLEYLFGIYYIEDGEQLFESFWAHDCKEEKAAFTGFMGFLATHLSKYPDAHIYHYNHYEVTALKRLACRYSICERQLDNLLRNQKFVDLYLIVRESIQTSEPSYSIKNLETFYMKKRDNLVATAAESIVVYNNWRETGKDELLQSIAEYNKMDCISTHLLRDWLISLKPKEIPWFESCMDYSDKKAQHKDWEIEYEDIRIRLEAMGTGNLNGICEQISNLLEFHNRESKSQWWNIFERQNKLQEELIEDSDCIAGLHRIGALEFEERYIIYSYRFPSQEYKLKVGARVVDVADIKDIGIIYDIDHNNRIVKIKRLLNKAELPESLSISAIEVINSKLLRLAIYRYAESFIKAPDKVRVATELLCRTPPRIKGKKSNEAISISDNDLCNGIFKVVSALDNSYLVIQGPPGSGKTYISSHVIVELVKSGKKIGITSNSHKAITNLLKKILNTANEKRAKLECVQKINKSEADDFCAQFVRFETKTENINLDADLFAGTAWTFAHSHFDGQLDYLFVDEAGQVALANVIAMSNAAKNIVLVGDQMQLSQPIQGIHPGDSGLSVLDFLIGKNFTISAEQGIFLGKTHRMCPSICKFISDAFYDGRLVSHESTKQRALSLKLKNITLPNEGIAMIHVEHEGCSQKSIEEGEVIKRQFQELLGQDFTDLNCKKRQITEDDILILTPYNAQLNYLRSILPDNAKVGTVDRFQGQEAPIVLISMVTSSAEELPRNIEFLYSKHRLNVAISRAQCLAIVVANAKLLDITCCTVEDMRLVNVFCYLKEYTSSGLI